MLGLVIAVASLVAEHRFQSGQVSAAVMHGLSSCGSWALEHGLSSCGEWVWLLCGTQNLPGPAIKPMSPALTGGFLSSATMEVLICVYFSLEDNGLQDCVDFCHIAT